MNPLRRLHQCGQSVWLDDLNRGLLKGGKLQRLIDEDGVTGLTSNPSLSSDAIAQSTHYDHSLDELLQVNPRLVSRLLAERMIVEDAQLASAVLRPVYNRTNAADGFVSIDISPAHAHDTAATVAEARRLWFEVARPNVMLKIPATPEAVPAVEMLIAQGININVTLAFSPEHYEAFAHAYLRGIARHAEPRHVSSVISVPVSDLNTAINRRLTATGSATALALRHKVAIAQARQIYRRFSVLFHGDGFAEAARRGAHVQKLLWASTGVQEPAPSDTFYLEALVARDTVAATGPTALDAFRCRGQVRGTLDTDATDEGLVLAAAEDGHLNLSALAQQVQHDGLAASAASHDRLLMTLERKRQLMTSAVR